MPEQRVASADAVCNKKEKRTWRRGGDGVAHASLWDETQPCTPAANVAIGHADVHFDAPLVTGDQSRRSEGA